MTDDPFETGMRVRREVLGDAHVERATETATPFTEPLLVQGPRVKRGVRG